MSSQGSSVLEVFQLNKNSKEDDLEQCIAWLRDVFHDNLPKTISVVVKRLGGYDPLNTTNLSKTTFKGLNTTVNASLMNNTLVGNQSFNARKSANESIAKHNNESQKDAHSDYFDKPQQEKKESQIAQNNSKSVSDTGNIQEKAPQISSNLQSPTKQLQNNQSNTSLTSNSSYISKNYDENDPISVADKAKHCYLNQNYNEALELYQKSQNLALHDEENNIKLIFSNKVYIGSIYTNVKQRQKAIEELKSAYEMTKRLNIKEIIETNEWNSKDGTQKFINSNPVYFINLTLGNLYNEEKDFQNAIFYFEEAYKEIQHSQNVLDYKNQSQILDSLGLIYYFSNNIPTAIEKFKHSLQIFEELLKVPEYGNDPSLKTSYANRINNLGEAYRRNKQIDEAIVHFKNSLKLKLEAQKENNDYSVQIQKQIANTYNNLGMSYYTLKQYDEAIEYLNHAIEIYENKIGRVEAIDQLSCANILNQRGDCYRFKLDVIKSCEDYKKSFKLKVDCLGEEHKSTILTHNNYAQSVFGTKNFQKSKQLFLDLLKIQKKVLGEKDPSVAQTLNNLGTVTSELREYELAEMYIKEALEIFQNQPETTSTNLERVKKNLQAVQHKIQRNSQEKLTLKNQQ
ncbi:tetratricopeptide repeat protein (macronuclear) [Tetrahymena thermophila SB210]|uniref:Tetratricopeptide repeat protein n=1 Tax=Tetrahymena thermophila (strain SB210) TaxID=312017 RepID=Q22YQ2_TETTS|nr:tetratricopeptide repeat protein [Tetrahymena thermophila SB210]EAR90619.1 tetratricopeptide repeat protein [Tetrahymena thermophila SB210]|eukprot:XP_001010864.1 tetratricopeptide repeat protein [Tetrahymena thermophila SB210]